MSVVLPSGKAGSGNRRWLNCRYADDFVLIVKGSKAQAEIIRDECREVLEGRLKLNLNMENAHITHVNDGFRFLGHRIIRKRGCFGVMRVVTGIPRGKARNFAASLARMLSTDYSNINKVGKLNWKLKGWAAYYQFTDFKAKVFGYIRRLVFWKLAHWLGRKYRSRIKSLLNRWYKRPAEGQAKTWVLFAKSNRGYQCGIVLIRLVGRPRKQFRWRLTNGNPYPRTDERNTFTSRYPVVTMVLSPV